MTLVLKPDLCAAAALIVCGPFVGSSVGEHCLYRCGTRRLRLDDYVLALIVKAIDHALYTLKGFLHMSHLKVRVHDPCSKGLQFFVEATYVTFIFYALLLVLDS